MGPFVLQASLGRGDSFLPRWPQLGHLLQESETTAFQSLTARHNIASLTLFSSF